MVQSHMHNAISQLQSGEVCYIGSTVFIFAAKSSSQNFSKMNDNGDDKVPVCTKWFKEVSQFVHINVYHCIMKSSETFQYVFRFLTIITDYLEIIVCRCEGS